MRPATNFEQRLRNVYHLLSSNTAPDPCSSLYHAIAALGAFSPTLTRDVEKTRRVLELGGALRMATGPGRQVGEERLLQLLSGLAYECCLMVQEARKSPRPTPRPPRNLQPTRTNPCKSYAPSPSSRWEASISNVRVTPSMPAAGEPPFRFSVASPT